jgi:5'-3' exonuclease
MSPKDIYKILRPFIRTVPIDFIKNMKIAVDGSAIMYFALKNARHMYHEETYSLETAQKVVTNPEDHEEKVMNYSETYYKNCLDVLSSKFSEFIIVFDGEEIPSEKNIAFARRLDILKESKEILDKQTKAFKDNPIDESHAKNFYDALSNYFYQDSKVTKNLIQNTPNSIVAPGEADKYCSYLCKEGGYQAVFSPDYDVLMYFCPIMIRDICEDAVSVSIIIFNEVIASLEINQTQFLDICILMGNDYNVGIERIGPKRSLQFIKKYQSLEQLEDTSILNLTPLNWKAVRKITQCYSKERDFLFHFPPHLYPSFIRMDKGCRE